MLGGVVVLAGNRGLTRDPIGSFGVADVEQLAGDEPALDPPLVGIDRLPVLGGQRQDPLGGVTCLVGAAKELDAAEDVAGVAVRLGPHGVQQRLGVLRLADDGDACLGDHGSIAAGAVGRAQRPVDVFGV